MRLHRYIAQAGITSRRKAEGLILEGRVRVNGTTILELGTKVEPGDRVTVDGRLVELQESVTVMMNKPKGVVTTVTDPEGRRTVMDLLPDSLQHLKPVGRLDKETEGLLLLTNEGELAARLTHAKFGVEKEYVATVRGVPDERELARMRRGLPVEGRRTAPADVEIVSAEPTGLTSVLRIILHEGRKRQVREMCLAIGHPVKALRRVRIGFLLVKGLAAGEVRRMPVKDLRRLRGMVGLDPETGSVLNRE
ncbi:MAG: rRNA pseudouridine synthase [Fimbriimonadaceae bacterium]|nr:rRNA pseudouridine synthase [Fimbriimonadaceae bacterium]